jgi:hypothetical protein
MTGLDMPEFDELDPEPAASGGDEGDAPDWLDLEQPDSTTLAEPQERPNQPAVAPDATPEGAPLAATPLNWPGPAHATGFEPVSRNGQNGHGGPPAEPRRRDSRRQKTAFARPVAPAAQPADNSLPAALAAAAAVAPDSEEAALLAAALVPLALAGAECGECPLRPAIPALAKGIAALAIWLIEEDRRGLIRLLPLILEEAVRDLSRAASEGRPITRGLAGDLLAEQTETILSRHGRGADEGHNAPRGRRRPSRRAGAPRPVDNWESPDDDDYR